MQDLYIKIFNTGKEDIPKLAEVIALIISDLKADQNSYQVESKIQN